MRTELKNSLALGAITVFLVVVGLVMQFDAAYEP